MGIRFRKSINLGGGARINLSKSGIGYSVGVKGARITKTANGRMRKTLSIPRSGISYVSESGSKRRNSTTNSNTVSGHTEPPRKLFAFIYTMASIILILLGALFALVEPVIGGCAVAAGVLFWFVGKHYRKKARKSE